MPSCEKGYLLGGLSALLIVLLRLFSDLMILSLVFPILRLVLFRISVHGYTFDIVRILCSVCSIGSCLRSVDFTFIRYAGDWLLAGG